MPKNAKKKSLKVVKKKLNFFLFKNFPEKNFPEKNFPEKSSGKTFQKKLSGINFPEKTFRKNLSGKNFPGKTFQLNFPTLFLDFFKFIKKF